MVEQLKDLYGRFAAMIGRLSPSQRWTLGSGLLISFVGLITLVVSVGSHRWESLVILQHMEAEESKKIVAFLDSKDIPYKTESGQLWVKYGERDRVLMELGINDSLPSDSRSFDWLFSESMIGAGTPAEFRTKVDVTKVKDLQKVIETLPGVEQAHVHFTRSKKLIFERDRTEPTAGVTIRTKGRRGLGNEEIQSVRVVVAYAVERLTPSNVAVIVDGRTYLKRKKSQEYEELDELTSKRRLEEDRLKEKVTSNLSVLYPLNAVQLSVVLDSQNIKKKIETTRSADGFAHMEQSDGRNLEGTGPVAQEAGVSSETGTGAPESPAAGGSNFTDKMTLKSKEQVPLQETHIESSFAPGQVKKVFCSVVVDEEMISRPSPAQEGQGLSREEILRANTESLRKMVMTICGAIDLNDPNVVVDVLTLPFALDPVDEPTDWAAVLLELFERYGDQFFLFAISLFGIIFLVRVLREAFAVPEDEEEEEDDLISPVKRNTEEDIMRMLDQEEESASDMRAKHIEMRVRDLVMENPEEAASLLERWMMEE